MAQLYLLLLSSAMSFFLWQDPPDSPNWSSNYIDAKINAQKENKKVLAIFISDDCDPCKQLLHEVNSDQQLKIGIEKDWIPVKIDVNTFDGYGLKKHFDINALPTTLLLDLRGDVIRKRSARMSSAEFLSFLSQKEGKPQPPKTKTDSPKKEQKTDQPKPPTTQNTPPQEYFTLQFGAFSSKENAKELKHRINQSTNTEVFIIPVNQSFKVFLGKFTQRSEAEQTLREMKQKGFDAFLSRQKL